jgi:hypothetical protein
MGRGVESPGKTYNHKVHKYKPKASGK